MVGTTSHVDLCEIFGYCIGANEDLRNSMSVGVMLVEREGKWEGVKKLRLYSF
jgi:hypothetical protein